jgi:hypothetical protein
MYLLQPLMSMPRHCFHNPRAMTHSATSCPFRALSTAPPVLHLSTSCLPLCAHTEDGRHYSR